VGGAVGMLAIVVVVWLCLRKRRSGGSDGQMPAIMSAVHIAPPHPGACMLRWRAVAALPLPTVAVLLGDGSQC
jgi:hypothetical protein